MYKYILIFALLFLTACSKVDEQTILEAREAVARGGVIVDVRTPLEFKAKHIEGALNLPLQSLEKTLDKLEKDKEVILYCRSGRRSAIAADMLRAKGYTVYDVATQSDWEREIPQSTNK